MRNSAWVALCLIINSGCNYYFDVDPQVHNCQAVRDAYMPARPETPFTSYDLETQYRIYTCANQYGEPPLLGYAKREFASEGEQAARFLEHNLRASNHDKTTRDDDALMQMLDSKIQSDSDRRLAEEDLSEIRARGRTRQ